MEPFAFVPSIEPSPPSPPSMYAHVFEEGEPQTPWPKLDTGTDKFLSILHAKYWGKDIRKEMRQWKEKQTGVQSMSTEENGVLPANFALNLDIKNFKLNVWVREDYALLYNYCTAYFGQWKEEPHFRPPSVVITGQPGIGKSYWIFYAVRRLLGERGPFIWYFDGVFHLFVEGGVFRCPERFFTLPFRPHSLWVLVDTDDTPQCIPPELTRSYSKLPTIFTSFPQEGRWKPITKTTMCAVVIMNPWSWEEVCEVAIVHRFTADKIKEARRAFDDLGPTARLCIDFVQIPQLLASYKSGRDTALAKLSISDLVQGVDEISSLKSDTSHPILLIRRVGKLNPGDVGYLQRYAVEPITSHVMQKVRFKLMEATREEQLRVYELFEPVSASRRLAGVVFESIAQVRLQKGVALTLVPMVRQPPASKGKPAHWKSQFNDESLPVSMEDSGLVGTIVANGSLSISIKPNNTIQYARPAPSVVGSGIYYLPELPNQETFDSFIVDSGVLYIFQFTSSNRNAIKGGLMDFFTQETLQTLLQGKEWRFVFVIPREAEIECPESSDDRSKEFWKKAKVFSAVFNP